MYLRHLNVLNFKNYAEAEVDFDQKVNCLVGINGSGKTNLLDAIYYLAFSKSFFNPSDSQNIFEDSAFFSIQGQFEHDDTVEKIQCSLKKGHKKAILRNGKRYERYADHIGLIPLVMISPIDILLLIEGGETRRKWIDGVISQFDKRYLDHLLDYNKALLQRNALLKMTRRGKQVDETSLQIWDEHLIQHGSYIFEKRKLFLEELIIGFNDYYNRIGDVREKVAIIYESQLNEEADFSTLLLESRSKDHQVQFTTVGIHKDELVFTIGDRPVKKFASQGQQKSVLMALRLAQAQLIRAKSGIQPLMLLDDIYDKLDSGRMSRLLELLNTDDFGQLFITDTNYEHLRDLLEGVGFSGKYFEVKSGILKPMGAVLEDQEAPR